jgi:hypothetical protein
LYSVTLNQAAGGEATAAPLSAAAGTTVTLAVASLTTDYSFTRWDVSPAVTWATGDETDLSAAFAMPSDNVTVTPVYRYDGVPVYTDATIDPSSAAFDKNTSSADHKDVSVTLSPGSYTLSAVTYGEHTLRAETDYTVSGNTYTIK